MKFTCSRDILFDAISKVSRAVSNKSTIPALEGIFIKAKNGKLHLTGYDLELGVSTDINANIEEEGDIVINARLFTEMIQKLPGESVSFVSEDLNVKVKSGITEFSFLGINGEDYPEVPVINSEESFSFSGFTLKSMIDQTIFAVATTDQNPIYCGSLFDIENGEFKMVSVDGCRLALRKEKINYEGKKKFVVPSKTLLEVSRFINPESEENVFFEITKKHILFKVENLTVISRLLEGEFLNYKATLNMTVNTTVEIDVRDLSESVNRVSLLINERIKSPVKCNFEDGLLKLSCTTAIGKAYDEIPCKIDGENFEIGFNNKYLIDALKATSDEKVKLLINNSISPMHIIPTENDNYLFLVLPVRLKG